MKTTFSFSMLLVTLLLCASTAFARGPVLKDSVDVSGLTEVQQAELAKNVALLKEKNVPAGKVASILPSAATMGEYLDLGERAGKSVAAFAKGLGLAGDEFMKSNTGKLIALVIFFKMAGGKILSMSIHFGAGLLVLAIALPFWWSSMRRCGYGLKKEKETLTSEVLAPDGTKLVLSREEMVDRYDIDNDNILGHWAALAAIVVVFLITVFTF